MFVVRLPFRKKQEKLMMQVPLLTPELKEEYEAKLDYHSKRIDRHQDAFQKAFSLLKKMDSGRLSQKQRRALRAFRSNWPHLPKGYEGTYGAGIKPFAKTVHVVARENFKALKRRRGRNVAFHFEETRKSKKPIEDAVLTHLFCQNTLGYTTNAKLGLQAKSMLRLVSHKERHETGLAISFDGRTIAYAAGRTLVLLNPKALEERDPKALDALLGVFSKASGTGFSVLGLKHLSQAEQDRLSKEIGEQDQKREARWRELDEKMGQPPVPPKLEPLTMAQLEEEAGVPPKKKKKRR